ncbi:MAG: tetratricopeptide repeat protein, partial [Chloroflexi bacterium]|nr:tetratricopeptide repeat protein [Chloroflexota bacterium]
MPGNRTVFKDSITKGHNAAWDAQWPKAVAEYRRALAEYPDDLSVRLNLAHALEESGQFESAQREYRHVADKQPLDPVPLTHVAEIHLKQNRLSEAAATYLAVADLYLQQKQLSKTIDAWNKVVGLEPERTDVRQHLAQVYEQNGRRGSAAREYLALARIFDKRGDPDKALAWAQRAASVDPNCAEAFEYVRARERPETPQTESPSPVVQAEKQALSRLAETLLEDQATAPRESGSERRQPGSRPKLSQPEIDALIARAVDAQMRHQVSDAIEAYRRLLDAGVVRPELKFNLGLLYFESMRYDDAVTFLTATVDDKSYGLASHFALGQCYRAQGQMDQAVNHFLQVTKIVDLNSVQREQADDLISVYEELADSYAAKGDRKRAEAFSLALEKFLTDKGWEDKIDEFRQHIENLRADGDQVSLAEVVGVPQSDKVLEALALAQEYVRRDKFWAASEECYRAIELAPNYMPGHVRLAEVLARAGRLDEAHSKYQTLAEISIARGDKARAEGFSRSALKIDGDDVSARTRLIDLLIQQDRVDEALEQFLLLGDTQVRAGQFGKAAERFAEGVRLAERQ